MMNLLLKWLRSAAAMIAGYALIVVLTTLTFKLTGSVRYDSSLTTIVLGTIGTSISGFCGGYLAGLIGRRAPFLHAVSVLLPLTADTIFVVTSGISRDPVWFDLIGSFTLMLFTLIGGWVCGGGWNLRRNVPRHPNDAGC